MTHEPDNPERDPALTSAWREHSAETPPAALDAAILAAAHRAVGSGPQDAGKSAAEATSPQRWWMPLAAAATIGAVAVGILQTMPQEQSITTPSVSDMPAPARERANAAPPASSAPAAPATPAAPAEQLSATQRKDAPRDKLETQARKEATRAVEEPAAAQSAASGLPPMAAKKDQSAAAPAPQPFPAETKAKAADSLDFLDRSRAAPQSIEADQKREVANSASSKVRGSEAAPPPMAAAPPPAPAPATAARDDRYQVAQRAPATSGAIALEKTAPSAQAASGIAADIDARIARIRRLHDEGKLADAAKELVALRTEVPDADARLPRELRAWAATVKP